MGRKKRMLWAQRCLSVVVCWLVTGAFAHAATFTVNSPADVDDANPGNGVCETAPGNGACTLRAAIQEANALAGTDTIILPSLPAPNAYVLTLVAEIVI